MMIFCIGDKVTLKDGTPAYVKSLKYPGGTILVVPLQDGGIARIVTSRDIVGKYGNVNR